MQHNFRPLSFSVCLLSSPVLLSLFHWFSLITPVSHFFLFHYTCLLSPCFCLISPLLSSVWLRLSYCFSYFIAPVFCRIVSVSLLLPSIFCECPYVAVLLLLRRLFTGCPLAQLLVRVGCPGFSFRFGHIVLSLQLFTGLVALLWYILIATLSVSRYSFRINAYKNNELKLIRASLLFLLLSNAWKLDCDTNLCGKREREKGASAGSREDFLYLHW